MRQMKNAMLLLFLAGCGGTQPPSARERTEGPVVVAEDLGKPCKADADCGAGTFCNAGYTFGKTTCVALIKVGGGFSAAASHCESGTIAGITCVDRNQCAADTSPCLDDAHCCNSGRVCLQHRCFVPLADGTKCWDDAQCQAAKCSFGVCGTQNACTPPGSLCSWDLECCAGAFCDNAAAGSSKRCTALRKPGASCVRAFECASKDCSNWTSGVCR